MSPFNPKVPQGSGLLVLLNQGRDSAPEGFYPLPNAAMSPRPRTGFRSTIPSWTSLWCLTLAGHRRVGVAPRPACHKAVTRDHRGDGSTGNLLKAVDSLLRPGNAHIHACAHLDTHCLYPYGYSFREYTLGIPAERHQRWAPSGL